jgi:hypothetical protein
MKTAQVYSTKLRWQNLQDGVGEVSNVCIRLRSVRDYLQYFGLLPTLYVWVAHDNDILPAVDPSEDSWQQHLGLYSSSEIKCRLRYVGSVHNQLSRCGTGPGWQAP